MRSQQFAITDRLENANTFIAFKNGDKTLYYTRRRIN